MAAGAQGLVRRLLRRPPLRPGNHALAPTGAWRVRWVGRGCVPSCSTSAVAGAPRRKELAGPAAAARDAALKLGALRWVVRLAQKPRPCSQQAVRGWSTQRVQAARMRTVAPVEPQQTGRVGDIDAHPHDCGRPSQGSQQVGLHAGHGRTQPAAAAATAKDHTRAAAAAAAGWGTKRLLAAAGAGVNALCNGEKKEGGPAWRRPPATQPQDVPAMWPERK